MRTLSLAAIVVLALVALAGCTQAKEGEISSNLPQPTRYVTPTFGSLADIPSAGPAYDAYQHYMELYDGGNNAKLTDWDMGMMGKPLGDTTGTVTYVDRNASGSYKISLDMGLGRLRPNVDPEQVMVDDVTDPGVGDLQKGDLVVFSGVFNGVNSGTSNTMLNLNKGSVHKK